MTGIRNIRQTRKGVLHTPGMRGFTACAVRLCGSDITRQFNFDKAVVCGVQVGLGDFLKKMYRRSAKLKVWQCPTDGSPVTGFPFVAPAEAVHSYLEIALRFAYPTCNYNLMLCQN
jgi:hypothetical protein